MSNGVLPPRPGTLHGSLFRRFERRPDLARLISVGGEFERVGKELDQELANSSSQELVTAYNDNYKTVLDSYASEQLSAMKKESVDVDCVSERLMLIGKLADQLVLLPRLFQRSASEDNGRLRGQLINNAGVYALVAEVIEAGFDHRQRCEPTSREREHTIGLLNEVTALALQNKSTKAKYAALPTLPVDDMDGKIDIHTFFIGRKGWQKRQLQVKSNEHHRGENGFSHGVLIGGCALGNSAASRLWPGRERPFQTAKAILRDVAGEITEEDHKQLASIRNGLVNAVTRNADFVEKYHQQFRTKAKRRVSANCGSVAVAAAK